MEEFFKRYTYDVQKDRIGGGSFGTVYKAYDNTLHREVAIKVSEQKVGTGGKVFSLKDEFNALKHVPKHPNIANYEELYTFKMPNGVFDYAVMQFYEDGNLSNAIRQGLTPAQKEEVSRALLEGISFLHEHSVVHRDLKPGNILIVKRNGHVIPLITDFGLSKETNAGGADPFSNSFGGGTLNYSSPEQLRGDLLHFNTDLWAYGAIVYEIFSGRRLFDAGSLSSTAKGELEVYDQIVKAKNIQEINGLPEPWRTIVAKCMVVDPKRRVQSAKELLNLLVVVTEPQTPQDDFPGGDTKVDLLQQPEEPKLKQGGAKPKPDDPTPNPGETKKRSFAKRTLKIIAFSILGVFVFFLIIGILASKCSAPDPDPEPAVEEVTVLLDTSVVSSDEGGSYLWAGGWIDGHPEGEGTITYFADDKYKRKSFEGEMKDGFKAKGKLIYTDGGYYEGTFTRDSESNFEDGTYHYSDGGKCEYKNGERQ